MLAGLCRRTLQGWKRVLAVVALLSLSAGCGAESPPLSELSLRDALSADPVWVAALPASEGQRLAQRMEEARAVTDVDRLPSLAGSGLGGVVQAVDAARATVGKDAAMLASLRRSSDGVVMSTLLLADSELSTAVLPPLLGSQATDSTYSREVTALRGTAGRLLSALLRRTGATTLMRVTQWPVAVVEEGGSLYVNAAWLVAMSTLEPAGESPAAQNSPAWQRRVGQRLQVSAYGFNPYNLPASLDACQELIAQTCECASSSSCSHSPIDVTFTSSQEECVWVQVDPEKNGAALCLLAFANIQSLQSCIQDSGACGPITTRAEAVAQVTNTGCVSAMDACLQDALSAGKDPISQAADSCGEQLGRAIGASCQRSCENSCNSCQQNSCQNTSCKGGSCGGKACTVAGPGGTLPLGHPYSPLWLLLWLFSPIAYVLFRIRR